jgi:hypothetical protein
MDMGPVETHIKVAIEYQRLVAGAAQMKEAYENLHVIAPEAFSGPNGLKQAFASLDDVIKGTSASMFALVGRARMLDAELRREE